MLGKHSGASRVRRHPEEARLRPARRRPQPGASPASRSSPIARSQLTEADLEALVAEEVGDTVRYALPARVGRLPRRGIDQPPPRRRWCSSTMARSSRPRRPATAWSRRRARAIKRGHRRRRSAHRLRRDLGDRRRRRPRRRGAALRGRRRRDARSWAVDRRRGGLGTGLPQRHQPHRARARPGEDPRWSTAPATSTASDPPQHTFGAVGVVPPPWFVAFRFVKGEIIFLEGDPPGDVYGVDRGTVKLSVCTREWPRKSRSATSTHATSSGRWRPSTGCPDRRPPTRSTTSCSWPCRRSRVHGPGGAHSGVGRAVAPDDGAPPSGGQRPPLEQPHPIGRRTGGGVGRSGRPQRRRHRRSGDGRASSRRPATGRA